MHCYITKYLFAGVGPGAKLERADLTVVGIEGDVNLAARLKHTGRLPAHGAIAGDDCAVLGEVREQELNPANIVSTT